MVVKNLNKTLMTKDEYINVLQEVQGVEFSKEQLDVILNKSGPTCVMSCAGSGKSTVLISNIEYLVSVEGAIPNRVLALSFNKDAVESLTERYKDLRKKLGKSTRVTPDFSTYHSLFLQLLKGTKHYRNVKVVDSSFYTYKLTPLIHTDGVAKAVNVLNRYFSLRSKIINDGKDDLLLNFIKGNKELGLDWYFKDSEINAQNFREVINEYENLKRQNNDIDFEDMMTLLYDELFIQGNKKIVEVFKDTFDYVYIDEYQDISKLQMEIVDKLLDGNTNFMCIGDADQCIYRFRGSSPEFILDFDLNYTSSKILTLGSNYRCKTNILKKVIPLIEKNNQRVKHDLTSYFDGGEVKKVVGEDLDFVSEIKRDIDNKLDPVILVRLNMQQKLLADVLVENNIAVKIKNADSTLRNDGVYKTIISLIRAVKEDDIDRMMSLRFKLFPWIRKEVWDKLLMYGDSWLDEIVYSGKYKVSDNTKQLIDNIKNKDLMQNLIINSYKLLEKSFDTQAKKGYVSSKEVQNIVKHMFKYSEGKDLTQFLKDENVKENILISNYENNVGVKINTMHSVKGLEFDCVYLYGLDNDIIPDEKRFKNMSDKELKDYIEEERRLFYVAWTRAKDKLVYHYTSEETKSMFIDELGKD